MLDVECGDDPPIVLCHGCVLLRRCLIRDRHVGERERRVSERSRRSHIALNRGRQGMSGVESSAEDMVRKVRSGHSG